MLHAADGSYNVALSSGTDTNEEYSGGVGIYSKSGGYRVNTSSTKPGIYAEDGALRGSVSDDEGAPAAGQGLYTPDGAWRLTTSGSLYYDQDGLYAKDGSLKVTVTNAD